MQTVDSDLPVVPPASYGGPPALSQLVPCMKASGPKQRPMQPSALPPKPPGPAPTKLDLSEQPGPLQPATATHLSSVSPPATAAKQAPAATASITAKSPPLLQPPAGSPPPQPLLRQAQADLEASLLQHIWKQEPEALGTTGPLTPRKA